MISRQRREYLAGALMTLTGAGSAYMATRYDLGTLTGMGTGFFPLVLSLLLAGLGIMIALTSGTSGTDVPDMHNGIQSDRVAPDWRGGVAIVVSVVLFVVLAQYAGLAPATFACVFVAAIGDRDNSWKSAGILSLCMTIFAVAVFSYGLRLQIPAFGRL